MFTTLRPLIFTMLVFSCVAQAAYIFPRSPSPDCHHPKSLIHLYKAHNGELCPSAEVLAGFLLPTDGKSSYVLPLEQTTNINNVDAFIDMSMDAEEFARAQGPDMKNGLDNIFMQGHILHDIQRTCVPPSEATMTFFQMAMILVAQKIEGSIIFFMEGHGWKPDDKYYGALISAVNENKKVVAVNGARIDTWAPVNIPTVKYKELEMYPPRSYCT